MFEILSYFCPRLLFPKLMKFPRTLLIGLAFAILVISTSTAQQSRPSDWDDIIAQPWYNGTVNGKPVFVFIDKENIERGYFFVANTSLPLIYSMQLKWNRNRPRYAFFEIRNSKIKVKFTGKTWNDTIAGKISTSRKNAVRLGTPPEFSLFLVKEALSPQSTSHLPRYKSPVFQSVQVTRDVSFGAATGYYVSMPVESDGYNYQQIILDAMGKMYVNPTREAILHILNRDPVSYALTDLQPLRMDIYQPDGDTLQKRPLIVLLHGGAFIIGDKATSTIETLANDFARKGYVVAAINYRIGFNPASKSSLERAAYRSVQDARAALRFLAYNSDYFRIDPNTIFLGGSSAGAITALNAAFMEEFERPASTKGNFWRAQPDLGELDKSTNEIQGRYRICAVVNLWGAVNDTSIIDQYENIPVLSIHGDADRIVPFHYSYPFLDLDTSITANIVSKLYGSLPIHRRLENTGIISELVTIPDAGHEPQFEPGKYEMVMGMIISRSTDFYFKSLFGFPQISGPQRIAVSTSPPLYSVDSAEDADYYWQITGGKRIPGNQKNQSRVVWLTNGTGQVRLQLVRKNGAVMDINLPVSLP